MGWQNSLQFLESSRTILSPALVIFSLLLPQLPLSSYPELQARVKFPPTERRPGVPPRTAGAGSRWIPPQEIEPPPVDATTSPGWSLDTDSTAPGSILEDGGLGVPSKPSCTPQSEIPLTGLMPSNNVGTTVAANPTLFWYVPKTNAKTAEFVIVDDNRNDVYRTTFALSGSPGVVQLKLPKTVSLEIGKNYLWQFEIICDPQNRQTKDKKYVQGLVRHVEISPTLKAKLDYAVSPLVKAKLYADAGIWHEALTNLAQIRSYQPTEWEEMLKSVGLDAIAQAPFVKCCTLTKY